MFFFDDRKYLGCRAMFGLALLLRGILGQTCPLCLDVHGRALTRLQSAFLRELNLPVGRLDLSDALRQRKGLLLEGRGCDGELLEEGSRVADVRREQRGVGGRDGGGGGSRDDGALAERGLPDRVHHNAHALDGGHEHVGAGRVLRHRKRVHRRVRELVLEDAVARRQRPHLQKTVAAARRDHVVAHVRQRADEARVPEAEALDDAAVRVAADAHVLVLVRRDHNLAAQRRRDAGDHARCVAQEEGRLSEALRGVERRLEHLTGLVTDHDLRVSGHEAELADLLLQRRALVHNLQRFSIAGLHHLVVTGREAPAAPRAVDAPRHRADRLARVRHRLGGRAAGRAVEDVLARGADDGAVAARQRPASLGFLVVTRHCFCCFFFVVVFFFVCVGTGVGVGFQ
eukprot:Rhum_TRINITY_DN11030_c0_g2::Rhum_TRINITY_DN11030_c0_g2_i1::g.41998::m.41998